MNNSQRIAALIAILHSYCSTQDDKDAVIDTVARLHRQGYTDEEIVAEFSQAIADGLNTSSWFWEQMR